mmetsp:Transcript_57921/g.141521  ORF Transcript_57921/g.141521 Transcript_57921/m.141521 type:complete len:591 (+) Transcript_57921:60-1832(+)
MSTDETPDNGDGQHVLLGKMAAKPNDDDEEEDDAVGGGEAAVGGTTAKDGDGTSNTEAGNTKKDGDEEPTDSQSENKEDTAVAEGGGETSVDGNSKSDDDDGQPPTKKQKLNEEGKGEEDEGDGAADGAAETTTENENGDEMNDTVMKKTTDDGGEDSKVEASDNIKTTDEGGEDASSDGKKEQDPSIVDKGDGASKQKDTEAESGSNENKPSNATESSTTKNGTANSATTANPYDSIKYKVIQNDGRPESLIKLVALKSLFSKQLPKMPRAYIARLVFDRRHISLAILNDKDPAVKDTDEEVIGAICYRPFHDMKFAEIAFCAVNSSHQVKGYGTKLMNLVKQEGARTGIEYFITYADNYAIGYFKKQGFSKQISMPKGRYQHLIKDYDGGTMMECYVHPSIDFTRVREMLEAQRQFVLSRIRLKANSTKVYDALPTDWKPDLEGIARGNELAARAMAVPGIAEAGWTIHDMQLATGQGKDADRARSALRSDMLTIVRKVDEQQFAWPFREPVDTDEVKDYLEVIKEPIDLSTIDKRIRKGDYYKSKTMLYTDLTLMVNNCKLYNEEASAYVQCAVKLENYLKQLFKDV